MSHALQRYGVPPWAVYGIAALLAFVLLYSIVVAAEILLGLYFVFTVGIGLFGVFLLYRFVLAFERIARAAEKHADARAREADAATASRTTDSDEPDSAEE